MAGVTGLEPATSGVTGQRSNLLSYTPASPRWGSRRVLDGSTHVKQMKHPLAQPLRRATEESERTPILTVFRGS